MNVKKEPVSSTNEDEQQRNVDEQPDIANVIVKQQPSTQLLPPPPPPPPPLPNDDFENDPEAGPSGLQTEQMRSVESDGRRLLRYRNDSSSDDDSGDERVAMWRPPESYRINRNDEDSGDTRYSNQSWRYDLPAVNEPQVNISDIAPSTSNQSEEVIDLSENESVHSNVPPTDATRSLEVLTAPDLQLDWLSDSSSDNEIVCTIRPQSPDRNAALNFTQSNLNTTHATNDLPAIDLTVSDDEETTYPREFSNGQTVAGSRANERMSLLYENHHHRLANFYRRNRCSIRPQHFNNEQRNDR